MCFPLTPAGILIVPFSLYMSLSVHGRFISSAEKEQRIYRLPARNPLGRLSLSGTVSGVTAHQAFILDLTRPRGDSH